MECKSPQTLVSQTAGPSQVTSAGGGRMTSLPSAGGSLWFTIILCLIGLLLVYLVYRLRSLDQRVATLERQAPPPRVYQNRVRNGIEHWMADSENIDRLRKIVETGEPQQPSRPVPAEPEESALQKTNNNNNNGGGFMATLLEGAGLGILGNMMGGGSRPPPRPPGPPPRPPGPAMSPGPAMCSADNQCRSFDVPPTMPSVVSVQIASDPEEDPVTISEIQDAPEDATPEDAEAAEAAEAAAPENATPEDDETENANGSD